MTPETIALLISAVSTVLLAADKIITTYRKLPAQTSQMQAHASVDYAEATQKWIDVTYDLNAKLMTSNEENFQLRQKVAILEQDKNALKTEMDDLRSQLQVMRGELNQLRGIA